jgi:hypothetical protein
VPWESDARISTHSDVNELTRYSERISSMNAKIIYGTAWYAQYASLHNCMANEFSGRRNEQLR